MNRNRIAFGVILVAIGGLLALDALGWAEGGDLLARWWPVAFLVFSVVRLTDRPPDYTGAAITFVIGIFLLEGTADFWPGDLGALLWPLLLVGVGLWLLLNRRPHTPVTAEQRVQVTALFSGREIVSHANPFYGASAVAAFGGVDLDLRGAVPAKEGAFVDATAAFGGVTVVVPPGWRVVMNGPAIFGGNEDHSQALGVAAPDAPLLTVRALALFGGVEVKAKAVAQAPVPAAVQERAST